METVTPNIEIGVSNVVIKPVPNRIIAIPNSISFITPNSFHYNLMFSATFIVSLRSVYAIMEMILPIDRQ